MRELAIILLICAWHREAEAQTYMNRDSLLNLLSVAKEDTAKVQLLLDIGFQYEGSDLQTAGKYYLMAGRLSEKLNYKQGIIKFIANYTYLLNVQGQYDSSMLYNKRGVEVAAELNDRTLMGKANANLGNVFLYTNMYDSAVYYYQKSLQYFEATGDKVLIARLNDLLQVAYYELRFFTKGLDHGKKAIAVLRNADEPLSLVGVLSNTGNIYMSLKQFDTALVYYREAWALAQQLNYKIYENTLLQNLANIHMHTLQTDSMRFYEEKALALSRELGLPESETKANRGMANYYALKNNFTEAHKYITRALDLSEKNGFREEHALNLGTLSVILAAMHRMEESFLVGEKAEAIQDSLIGADIQQRTLLLSKQFETEKKEAQIELQKAQLKQKSILSYILIGSITALLIISLLGYRNYRHRQRLQQSKIDELETEKQLAATEAILKGEEQERTRLAKDLHDGLGGMLSGIKYSFQNMKGNLILTPENAQAFERSIDMLDSSIREMRRVAHNMMPEMLVKYGLNVALKEFCNEIDRSGVIHVKYQPIGMNDSNVEQTTAITVYRIVQELVNNAIKHAAASHVVVQLQLSGQLLSVTVEDNGKGFDTALLQRAQGMGWNNIRNRVDFLKGKIDVHSAPDKGTSVLMEIPLS
ncbi:MAG: hypothetical protein KIT62_07315 [Cyclobacteriaceae bacterium]|nr:hypothetical protein [Cyclobacteriaceae bacterium]